jgi:hypothetical protein
MASCSMSEPSRATPKAFPTATISRLSAPRLSSVAMLSWGIRSLPETSLARNWPDRAEDLLRRQGHDIVLLNLSGDAWGLANWTSIITGMLETEAYQLDGLIFAVWAFDLRRVFFYSDHRGQARHAFAPTWDPSSHPQNVQEALSTLDGAGAANSWIVSAEDFNAVLRGDILLESNPKWRFALLKNTKAIVSPALCSLRRKFQGKEHDWLCPREREPNKLRLYDTIRHFAAERDLPILVLYIPTKKELLSSTARTNVCLREEVRHFAEYIGADFSDGRDAFAGVKPQQVRQLWFPTDLHWDQGGSDIFAHFMAMKIHTSMTSVGQN